MHSLQVSGLHSGFPISVIDKIISYKSTDEFAGILITDLKDKGYVPQMAHKWHSYNLAYFSATLVLPRVIVKWNSVLCIWYCTQFKAANFMWKYREMLSQKFLFCMGCFPIQKYANIHNIFSWLYNMCNTCTYSCIPIHISTYW